MNHTDPSNRARAMALDGIALTGLWLVLAAARSMLRDLWTLDLIPGADPILEEVSFILHAWMAVVLTPAWLWALARLRTYDDLHTSPRWRALLSASGLALLLSLGLFFALHTTDFLSRSLVFSFALIASPMLALSRAIHRRMGAHSLPESDEWRVVLVGSAAAAARILPSLRAEVIGRIPLTEDDSGGPLPVLGTLDALDQVLLTHPIDQILLAEWDHTVLQQVARCCEEPGVPFSVEANFLNLTLAQTRLERHGSTDLLTFSALPSDPIALAAKRILDLVGAVTLLLMCAPIMLLAAAVVRLTDGGPVLFAQERVGRFGRRFTMYKFRSMVLDAEKIRDQIAHLNEMDGPVFKSASDPRITGPGRWLRRLSIDELPQLVNVLRGEMSLVGPRPPLPDEVASYQRWQRRRLSVRPGLTCIWQVSGRNQIDFDTWIRLDLEYIDNWSLLLDVKLLLQTIPVVLTGYGAR
ncbi:MAG: exopolysaccharide biosynthesis polyprenyl glycosylphosphotransferase [Myxococcota bacterium]|jgi:exopolysaccharide biosynthesis polyprenyl glycosylphosphotransferase